MAGQIGNKKVISIDKGNDNKNTQILIIMIIVTVGSTALTDVCTHSH